MMVETKWIRENRSKLCPLLRNQLVQSYRIHSWIPCIFHKTIRAIKQKFTKIPIVLQLKDEQYVKLQNQGLERIFECKVKHYLPITKSFTTRVSIGQLQQLINNPGIERIWLDREIEAFLDVASPLVNAFPIWNEGTGGEGVGIAILDTGIHPHPDLTTPENRIVAFKDFVNDRSSPYDDNGHGTHCAGDAASNGGKSLGKYSGPAPKANLIGIKVLNKMGSGVMSDMLAGIQWTIDNKEKYNIRVLSMSLGAKAVSSYKDDPLCEAVERAWEAGITVCVAAGNEGPGARTISTPGIDPKIITVGALNDGNTLDIGDDSIAEFSSRGPTIDGLIKPDVVAPGVGLVSLRSPNSYLDKNQKDARVGEWYTSLSGTSMATPVCAGIAALLIDKNDQINPDQIKTLLRQTSRDINNESKNNQGEGLIDGWKAHQSISS